MRSLGIPVPRVFRGSLLSLSRRLLLGIVLAVASGSVLASGPQTISIQFGAQDQVVFSGNPAAPQRIQGGAAPARCALRHPNGDPQYIRFSAPPGLTPGFYDKQDLVGLREVSGGVPCGRVGAAPQFLRLELGSHAPADRLVVGTTLNFNIRNNVIIRIEAHGPFGAAQTYEVRSGAYRTGAASSGPIGPDGVFNCAKSASCRVELHGAAWSELVLRTANDQPGVAGEWSLGSGNSEFVLGEVKTIGCGEQADLAETENAFFRRLDDAVPGEACVPLPYTLTFSGQTLEFLADYGVLDPGTEPAFEWRATWDPEPVSVPDFVPVVAGGGTTIAASLPPTLQQFVTAPSMPDPVFDVDLCFGIPQFDADGLLSGLKLVDGPGYDMSALDGIQYGCYLTRDVDLLQTEPSSCPDDPDQPCVLVQVKETGYVRGDWTATRTLR